jgi:hypothetical protein
MCKTLIECKCFAAFEFHDAREPRIDNSPSRTRIIASCGDQNPSRPDDRATPVALKPFDLLIFLAATKR